VPKRSEILASILYEERWDELRGYHFHNSGEVRIHDYGYKRAERKEQQKKATVSYLETLKTPVERFKAIFNSSEARRYGYDDCDEQEIYGVSCVFDPRHISAIMPKSAHDQYEGSLKEKQGITYDCNSLSLADLKVNVDEVLNEAFYVSDSFPERIGFNAKIVDKAVRVFYPRLRADSRSKIRVHYPTNKSAPLVLSTEEHDHIIAVAPYIPYD
jgi:hypothetical protein